ncbi:ABC transporter permease [Streptomyces sp. NPDC091280]|uniref:ABC transporter permease n=1 Tax=Streptomyces sp. NPDC091280 TaxID=3365984 RepID=UPI003816230B
MDVVTGLVAKAAIVFLYVPIVAVIVLSFNDSDVTYKWGGFTTRWYDVLLHDTPLLDALRTSVIVGAVSATLATVLGFMAAAGLNKSNLPGKKLFTGLLAAPLIIPEIVLGAALLTVFVQANVSLGFTTLSVSHLVVTLPYAVLILTGAYSTLDPSLPEAATDLGCTGWQTMRRVTIPLMAPSLLATWLLTFTISFGTIVISTFTNGVGTTTLPLRVYSLLKTGLTPEINALGTVLIGVTMLIVLLVGARQMRDIVASDRN